MSVSILYAHTVCPLGSDTDTSSVSPLTQASPYMIPGSEAIVRYLVSTDMLTTQMTQTWRFHVFAAYVVDAKSGLLHGAIPDDAVPLDFRRPPQSRCSGVGRLEGCVKDHKPGRARAIFMPSATHYFQRGSLPALITSGGTFSGPRARRRRGLTPKSPQGGCSVPPPLPTAVMRMQLFRCRAAVGEGETMYTLPVICDTEPWCLRGGEEACGSRGRRHIQSGGQDHPHSSRHFSGTVRLRPYKAVSRV
ncbi:hypothetical protein BC628DRAFT_1078843 [Trametes gibbosa]|nr:hypothetical protein BC628DRAFT_1078843 [Trametes gibbosa]